MTTPAPYAETVKRYERLAEAYDRRWHGYNQLTLRQALEALQLSGPARLLDVGCGTGEFERLAVGRFPSLTIAGLDATPAMVAVARKKLAGCSLVSFQVAEAEALPFDPGQFDAVVSVNALHHMRNLHAFLQESFRVLGPSGQFVLVDWCRDPWHCRLLHYGLRLMDRSYVRMYRVAELTALVEAHGFVVEDASRFIAPPRYGMLRLIARKRAEKPR